MRIPVISSTLLDINPVKFIPISLLTKDNFSWEPEKINVKFPRTVKKQVKF